VHFLQGTQVIILQTFEMDESTRQGWYPRDSGHLLLLYRLADVGQVCRIKEDAFSISEKRAEESFRKGEVMSYRSCDKTNVVVP